MQGGDARTINKPFLYSLPLKRKLTSRVQKDDINKRSFLKLRLANIGLNIYFEKPFWRSVRVLYIQSRSLSSCHSITTCDFSTLYTLKNESRIHVFLICYFKDNL